MFSSDCSPSIISVKDGNLLLNSMVALSKYIFLLRTDNRIVYSWKDTGAKDEEGGCIRSCQETAPIHSVWNCPIVWNNMFTWNAISRHKMFQNEQLFINLREERFNFAWKLAFVELQNGYCPIFYRTYIGRQNYVSFHPSKKLFWSI